MDRAHGSAPQHEVDHDGDAGAHGQTQEAVADARAGRLHVRSGARRAGCRPWSRGADDGDAESATFTTVESSMTINWAAPTTTRAAQGRARRSRQADTAVAGLLAQAPMKSRCPWPATRDGVTGRSTDRRIEARTWNSGQSAQGTDLSVTPPPVITVRPAERLSAGIRQRLLGRLSHRPRQLPRPARSRSLSVSAPSAQPPHPSQTYLHSPRYRRVPAESATPQTRHSFSAESVGDLHRKTSPQGKRRTPEGSPLI